MMELGLTENNSNEYAGFEFIKATLDEINAKVYFEEQGETVYHFLK